MRHGKRHGRVSKRKKKSSQPFRDEYGHTPLSIHEAIPWGDQRLIVGTGVEGRLPVMAEVYQEADRRGVEIVTLPTEEACKLLSTLDEGQVHAIIHVTC
jgi:hypothetical protein